MDNAEHAITLDETLVRLNVKRVSLTAMLALLFQLTNAFNDAVYHDGYLGWGVLCVAFISLGYLLLSYLVDRNGKVGLKSLRRLYRGYWILLTLCMSPFFISDVITGMPTNIVLFFSVLVFAPVFSMQENKALFPFFVLYVVVVVMLCGAGFAFGLRTAGIGIAGSLLSYSLHNGYIEVIKTLRVEGDTDSLTKLYNKNAGLARMNSLVALCRRMDRPAAAYYIDIDYFKSYNDTFGHLAGDHALASVADCIRRCFARETDVLCRLGGEEFAAVIPVAEASVALLMAKRLIHMVSDMGLQSGLAAKLGVVTISIGVAMLDPCAPHPMPVDALIGEADRQLYIAKNGGRNCIAMSNSILYRNEQV